MKILWNNADGGSESNVRMWGLESKRLGSILLLRFGKGSREAYHTHAFNSVSWVLTGGLRENHFLGLKVPHLPSFRPVYTYRETFHKVEGINSSNWVITFRGPWVPMWREYRQVQKRFVKLTHGRVEV